MNSLRTVGLGVGAMAVLLVVVFAHMWLDRAIKRHDREALLNLTPSALIASCGQSTSDELFINDGNYMFATRVISYKGSGAPGWAKLEFDPIGKNIWRLRHFASPEIGVHPEDENSYLAVSQFPCIGVSELARASRRFIP